jgi:hypothetical protein
VSSFFLLVEMKDLAGKMAQATYYLTCTGFATITNVSFFFVKLFNFRGNGSDNIEFEHEV